VPITSRFTESALFEYGLRDVAREWIGAAVYREKLRAAGTAEVAGTFLERAAKTASIAGITVNLLDRADCPWAG
jgi:hypothetical protein